MKAEHFSYGKQMSNLVNNYKGLYEINVLLVLPWGALQPCLLYLPFGIIKGYYNKAIKISTKL